MLNVIFGLNSFCVWPFVCSFANLTVVSRLRRQLANPHATATATSIHTNFDIHFHFYFHFHFHSSKLALGARGCWLIIICHQLAEGVDVRGKPSGREQQSGGRQQKRQPRSTPSSCSIRYVTRPTRPSSALAKKDVDMNAPVDVDVDVEEAFD